MRATLERASPARIARRPTRRQLIKAGITTVLLLFAFFALPALLSLYYIDTMTQVAVYSMVAVALGVLVGRVGLVSLGQVAVLAIGAWSAARLLFATTLTFLVISSLAAVLIARLRSITVTFVAAIVIGLLHDLLTPIASLTSYRDMTPFVIAAVGLLVLSRHQVMTQSREEA